MDTRMKYLDRPERFYYEPTGEFGIHAKLYGKDCIEVFFKSGSIIKKISELGDKLYWLGVEKKWGQNVHSE